MCSNTWISAPHLPLLPKNGQRKQTKYKGSVHLQFRLVQLWDGMSTLFEHRVVLSFLLAPESGAVAEPLAQSPSQLDKESAAKATSLPAIGT